MFREVKCTSDAEDKMKEKKKKTNMPITASERNGLSFHQ